MADPKADVLGHVLDKTFPELPGDIAPSTRAQLVLARLSEAGYVLDAARASRPEPIDMGRCWIEHSHDGTEGNCEYTYSRPEPGADPEGAYGIYRAIRQAVTTPFMGALQPNESVVRWSDIKAAFVVASRPEPENGTRCGYYAFDDGDKIDHPWIEKDARSEPGADLAGLEWLRSQRGYTDSAGRFVRDPLGTTVRLSDVESAFAPFYCVECGTVLPTEGERCASCLAALPASPTPKEPTDD